MRSLRLEVDGEHGGPGVRVAVDQQPVAGDARVVHDDVERAVAGQGEVGDASSGVGCGHVDLERGAADRVGGAGERLSGRGHVHGEHPGALTREDVGDRGTDAPSGAGDRGDGPLQRPGGVVDLADGTDRCPHPHHLPVDEGRARAQQEGEGRPRRVVGAVRHQHQVGRGALAQAPSPATGSGPRGPAGSRPA
ncbi:hypothetical protein GCM10025868_20540 [Angustibacter aerolatus]|uniref:Uncharacterized protein n=1 Tax=Angustibacter aerolatus TaxID=1162965 RepID=A0ABQ6JG95_9ACTN|nr:hypothetical protein GCM10025868_20540 [Angustibacter aerolatus]